MLFKFDPNKPENIIKDRTKSLISKVYADGTSREKAEWAKYSNSTVYKGFACIIAMIPTKSFQGYSPDKQSTTITRFKGIAKEIRTSHIDGGFATLETPFCKEVNETGKLLYKLIDSYRKRGTN
jgi:hypothetical protein